MHFAPIERAAAAAEMKKLLRPKTTDLRMRMTTATVAALDPIFIEAIVGSSHSKSFLLLVSKLSSLSLRRFLEEKKKFLSH